MILKVFQHLILAPLAASLVIISAKSGNNGTIVTKSPSNHTYWQKREDLIKQDYSFNLGKDLVLTENEQALNDALMVLKNKEMDDYFSSLKFPPSLSFFKARDAIERSEVFKIIKQMPKGAVLHAHDLSLASIDWVISELTYWDDLYICQNEKNLTVFRFFEAPDLTCDWKLVKDERLKKNTTQEYDDYLYKILSIFTSTPEVDYPNINHVWRRMENCLFSLVGLVSYVPAWVRYLEKAMQGHVADNVLYLEFRGVLPLLYDKNGTIYNEMETLAVYDQVITNFTNSNRGNFFGARFIYAPLKPDDLDQMWRYVTLVQLMKSKYPSLVAGFDLVGQEDAHKSLKEYIDPLLTLVNGDVSVPFFFHAGETDWYGLDPDENLFDAILLNASRLGHAYAISKHPLLMEVVKKSAIPIEICPISNQVLMLLDDLRNHPMIEVISRGLEVVVSSDDPAVWGADPLSHDFYEAFYALGGARADLRFLKKLIMNSIKYSTLEGQRLQELQDLWQMEWDKFIRDQLLKIKTPQDNAWEY